MVKKEVAIQKVDLKSMDIVKEQREKLKQLFPEVFSEDKINFEKLKKTLGENIDESLERYEMNWAGKTNCFKIIQEQSLGTLKPVEKESINWDKTQNLFIEGDNLEVLKLLQKSYNEKIKMIYIDPPYNTGHDFVYKDSFGQQLGEYLKITGQVDEDGKVLSTNTDSDGRYHSNWMSMIYPRLFLARNLLREDGAIFISIDDKELDNLKKVCNELFGEENFVGIFIRRTRSGGGFGTSDIGIEHDYILCYSKNRGSFNLNKLNKDEQELKKYFNKEDNLGSYHLRELKQSDNQSGRREDRPYMFYGFTLEKGKLGIINQKEFEQIYKNGKFDDNHIKDLGKRYTKIIWPVRGDGKYGRWTCGYETACNLISEGNLECINDKIFNKERMTSGREEKVITTLLNDNEFTNTSASIELKQIIDNGLFDFPKPIKLLEKLIDISTSKASSDIVLDFFAGSGTTGHAVLNLNKEDGGDRKFILVQLPELTNENSEAYKTGYKHIAHISQERMRKVIAKIKNEKGETKQKKLSEEENKTDLDLGFKIFRLDKSNFKIWDSQAKDIQTALNEHINPIKVESSQEDVLYELILKSGLSLTTDIKEIKIGNKKVFSIEDGMLLICLEKELTSELIRKIAEMKPARFYCLDEGFKGNDQLKANAVEIFKNVETVDGEKIVFRTV